MLALAFLLAALASPARDIAVWTGLGDNDDWDNPANWSITPNPALNPSGTSVSLAKWNATHPGEPYPQIPFENTAITMPSALKSAVINLVDREGVYKAIEFNLLSPLNGTTMNLQGTGTGWLTFDLDGVGARRTTTSDDAPQVIFNVGHNATLKLSGNKAGGADWDDTPRPIPTGSEVSITTGNFITMYLRLRDNAVFDITEIDYGLSPHSVDNGPFGARVSLLDATPGTKINVGASALIIGSGMAKLVGLSNAFVCAADIDASAGGVLRKTGYGTAILAGNNNFQASGTLAAYIDGDGFLTPRKDAAGLPLAENRNMVFNNISYVDSGILIVGENSSIGAIRVYNRVDTVLGGSGTTGTVLLERGIVSPGMAQNNAETGTLRINGHYAHSGGANTTEAAVLWIDIGSGGNYDKLAISGSALIGAAAKMRLWSPSGYMAPGEYKFLTADMGITGSFSAANTSIMHSLTLAVVDPDDPVKLVTEGNGAQSFSVTLQQESFADVEGLSKGQQTVGKYLDHLVSLGNPGDVD
ncbi:MAG: hypothetical protein LBM92_01460, partial [Opitutaceae bacterium]|nr:hypothetical protein [Opitutaceae bacterium]